MGNKLAAKETVRDYDIPMVPGLDEAVDDPGRAAAVAKFLDYVGMQDDVWVATRLDIARHWREHHPPGATT